MMSNFVGQGHIHLVVLCPFLLTFLSYKVSEGDESVQTVMIFLTLYEIKTFGSFVAISELFQKDNIAGMLNNKLSVLRVK